MNITIIVMLLYLFNKAYAVELLNSSYDVSRELFISINKFFKKTEKKHS